MKKIIMCVTGLLLALTFSQAWAQNPAAAEKKVLAEDFQKLIPKDRVIGLEAFKKVWEEVLAGKKKAYLLDVRSHPEFYAFHIEGSDHISEGRLFSVPRLIPDPKAEIYIFCQTGHRAIYAAGLLTKYGYKNVYLFEGGILEWAKAGLPFVNQFVGRFVITEYSQDFREEGKYRIREFHPY
jgi:rhodanese-related sulfurtransferase